MNVWLANQRISVKLRLMFVALSCGLIATTVTIYSVLEFQSLRSDLECQFTNLVDMVAHSSRAAVAFSDAGGAETMAEAAISNDQVRGVVISDVFDNVLAAKLPPSAAPAAIAAATEDVSFTFVNGGSIARARIVLDDEHIGDVYVLGNNRALDAEKRKLLWMVVGAFLTTMLAAAALSLPLDRMLARPIARLAAEMEQLGTDSDYRRRVKVVGSDEVAGLYARFNAMLDEIESRDGTFVANTRGSNTRCGPARPTCSRSTMNSSVTWRNCGWQTKPPTQRRGPSRSSWPI